MKYSLLSLIILALFSISCASISDAINAKDDGTVANYAVNHGQGWEIALKVLRWEDAETIEEHKDENYMVTTVGLSFMSSGSVVAVWVEPEGEGVKVTCVTKRKVSTNIATGLTETTFHRRFKQGVNMVKAGKQLPSTAPTE